MKFIKNITNAKETLEKMIEGSDIVLMKDDINDIREALDKQIPKEVDTEIINRGISISGEYDIDSHMLCPNCKAVVGDYKADELYFDYCPTCGQKLKYSEL